MLASLPVGKLIVPTPFIFNIPAPSDVNVNFPVFVESPVNPTPEDEVLLVLS